MDASALSPQNRNSVPEVVERQGQVGHLLFDDGHCTLQIVSFGACDADRLALDRGLNFEFAVFDETLKFFRVFGFDAIFHTQHHFDFVAAHLLCVTFVDESHIHLALGEFAAQDVLNLTQLEICVANQGDLFVLEFDGRCCALEVKARANFLGRVVNGIFNFNQIGFANGVK